MGCWRSAFYCPQQIFVQSQKCWGNPARTQGEFGDPCRNRTCDNLLRRQVLYPAELRGRPVAASKGRDRG